MDTQSQRLLHPKALDEVISAAIEHVHRGTPVPRNLEGLTKWYENNGIDTLLASWEDFSRALNLRDLARSRFSDDELSEAEGITSKVDDAKRVDYARRLISEAFDTDIVISPSVHVVELTNEKHGAAILAWLVEFHGQGGVFPVFQGLFRDRRDFYCYLQNTGHVLDTEESSISDSMILSLWERSTEVNRTVKVFVKWGNSAYDCPMSQRTWRRIVAGKSVKRVVPFYFEGKRSKGTWEFNKQGFGSLVVTYDGEAVAFDGNLSDSSIIVDDQQVKWESE